MRDYRWLTIDTCLCVCVYPDLIGPSEINNSNKYEIKKTNKNETNNSNH